MYKPNGRQRIGVTLIEAVMVIVLLAAAAGTSLLYLNNQWWPRRHVTAATNDVANTLITARSTAIVNQAQVRVRRVRSGSNEQLLITEDAGPHHAGKTWTVDLGNQVQVRGGPQTIRFQPAGSAHRQLTWDIRDSGADGRVTVQATSGKVERILP